MDKLVSKSSGKKNAKKTFIYPNPIPAVRTSQNIAQCNLKNTTPLEERTAKNGWCTFG